MSSPGEKVETGEKEDMDTEKKGSSSEDEEEEEEYEVEKIMEMKKSDVRLLVPTCTRTLLQYSYVWTNGVREGLHLRKPTDMKTKYSEPTLASLYPYHMQARVVYTFHG